MIRVLGVSSWGTACGIADYLAQLKSAVEAADPEIQITPSAEALDPMYALAHTSAYDFDVCYLNHHDALHSRWVPEHVQQLQLRGVRVITTYHDTLDGTHQPNSQKAHALAQVCDAFIVHEPVSDIPNAILIRQGVPAAEYPEVIEYLPSWKGRYPADHIMVPYTMPILGTVGFNFPWKNFDRIAQVSAECGWACVILSNNATDEDEARWRGLNPWAFVRRGFKEPAEIVRALTACDATLFAYECANTGTSGAIRLGLAARKPLIAWECRQFRDLREWPGAEGRFFDGRIHWCSCFADLPLLLAHIPIQRVDPGIVQIAERDSWVRHGRRYAEIFRKVVGR